MSDEINPAHEVMKLDAERHLGKPMQDFERLMCLMAYAKPMSRDKLIRVFCLVSGVDQQRAEAAFDECVIKGYIGTKPDGD